MVKVLKVWLPYAKYLWLDMEYQLMYIHRIIDVLFAPQF